MNTILGLALATVLGALPVAAASTNQEVFDKLLAKFALESTTLNAQNFKPKLACGCIIPGGSAAPGFVTRKNIAVVDCALPSFASDGSLAAFSTCNGPFVVLH